MLIGVSFKTTDKRVDKVLAKNGLANAEVYYSPIKTAIYLLLLLLSSGGAILLFELTTLWPICVLIIFLTLVSYPIQAYSNNSAALTPDKLIIINPNFPFKKFIVFSRDEIIKIEIGENTFNWRKWLAFVGGNFIEVTTKKDKLRFYCAYLELDAYDENWTEKTIDDLHASLKNKNFPVEFNIEG